MVYSNVFLDFQNGFDNGFDNGYNKGYYFGYSAASAYLYRFYKKYYADYMKKYRQRLTKLYANKYRQRLMQIKKMRQRGGAEKEEGQILDDKYLDQFYDFDEEQKKNLYLGLPAYMAPENVFSLEILQPPKKGIFYLFDWLLNPPKPPENPRRHCYKPSKEKLNRILRKNFHPKFRDAIIGTSKNWDSKVFRKSCNNRAILKLMEYCPHKNHPS